MARPSVEERFWAKVDKTETCWFWIGTCSSNGYGHFMVAKGTVVGAHRFAYELLVGPIPTGYDLDHLCRIRRCVNVAHLEPVTRAENLKRGIKGALTTHCPQGHPYDEDNTRIRPNGHRECRACNAARLRRWRRLNK